jgi:hypothetical protein
MALLRSRCEAVSLRVRFGRFGADSSEAEGGFPSTAGPFRDSSVFCWDRAIALRAPVFWTAAVAAGILVGWADFRACFGAMRVGRRGLGTVECCCDCCQLLTVLGVRGAWEGSI